jgi:hypothetical protein
VLVEDRINYDGSLYVGLFGDRGVHGFDTVGWLGRSHPPYAHRRLWSLGAIGAFGTTAVPPITPPITPPIEPPATPPGTPPATPEQSTSGGIGASLMSAMFFGITLGATNLPAFSNTLCGGITFPTAGAGGGGDGGGVATRNIDSSCSRLSVSVKKTPTRMGAVRIAILIASEMSASSTREHPSCGCTRAWTIGTSLLPECSLPRCSFRRSLACFPGFQNQGFRVFCLLHL